ncbi:hypothetical protein J3458_008970 [Metarhizium acridum]|uniref:uncharacterized protein n=1 Tax=Metarhizium acridum TaxID=92637 RepID=UPI001C6B6F2D|nr:hypothetical protein J3458_008970 [Metarhizium acridum]
MGIGKSRRRAMKLIADASCAKDEYWFGREGQIHSPFMATFKFLVVCWNKRFGTVAHPFPYLDRPSTMLAYIYITTLRNEDKPAHGVDFFASSVVDFLSFPPLLPLYNIGVFSVLDSIQCI